MVMGVEMVAVVAVEMGLDADGVEKVVGPTEKLGGRGTGLALGLEMGLRLRLGLTCRLRWGEEGMEDELGKADRGGEEQPGSLK